LVALTAGLGLLSVGGQALAGAQLEEPLADSVRGALTAAISNSAPPVPEFSDTDSRLAYLSWLGRVSPRLQKQ
jgi:hypothetical protein